MPILRVGTGAALALLTLSHAAAGQEHEHGAGSAEHLGTVSFATSCSAAAQPQFDRAVALLHSFEFAPAIQAFEAAGTTDPSCGIAYWGVALGAWGNPFAAGQKAPAQIQRGQDAIERANRAGARTERERGYIAAVAELYRDPDSRDQRTRVLAYRDAMAALAASDADDIEASIFYALALAQAVPPTDKTYADLLKAGAILEKLFATHPDHPGLAHYIIHSYDVPALAPRALDAARRYARIAPSAPHALHMPSHTFTRMGYWQESIDDEHRLGRGRQARWRHRRGTARDRLPDLRVPADRPGRGCEATARLAARDRGALRSRRGRLRRPRCRRRLRAGRDSRALGARAPRMGRGREARSAPEPFSADGGHDVLRPRPRRRPHRRPRGRAVRRSTRSSSSATG